jgi:SagB-type dehydrogenase family enzyme
MKAGMITLAAVSLVMTLGVAVAGGSSAGPTAQQIVKLPAPQIDRGRPLMEVLGDRQSRRTFDPRPLPEQEMSNLLWAACGVNRPESGKCTAPSALNWQEIDVYVATAEALYLFDRREHTLTMISDKDIRALTGQQGFVAEAPVNLVYVADYSRMGRGSEQTKAMYSAADTGFISQNVYLYCASEGLATVVRGSIDREVLAEAMGLGENQKIVLSQTVGYPG